MKYFHFCGYNLLSAGAETPVFSGVMRCKPDVASPTGCRAASCRFLSFSVVFLPFRPASPAVRSSCLPRRPLLPSSPPTAPPVFSAVRSSCLLRRPLLSSPPSPLPFFRAPSRSGSLYLYYCAPFRSAPFRSAPFRSAPFRERRRSVFCPSPRPRLFPLAPLPSRALPVPLPRPVSASSQHIFLLSD